MAAGTLRRLWPVFPAVFFLLLLPVPLAAQPLQPGSREFPGAEPSDRIMLRAPDANSVEVRHSGDGWAGGRSLAKGDDGVWSASAGELGWPHGAYAFKFLVDGEWEDGENRTVYVDREGQIVHPPARLLTWQRDPTTTMTAVWLTAGKEDAVVHWREAGTDEWQATAGSGNDFPFAALQVHRTELTGLKPGTLYEFRLGEDPEVRKFATLPSTLEKPVRFIQGGDIYHNDEVMDRMTVVAGGLAPDFAVIGGDFAYADGHPDNAWRWVRLLQSFSDHFTTPDGRMIPIVVAIGNHEVRRMNQHQINDDAMPRSADERRELAPYYHALFPFPAEPTFGTLDVGDYLSFVILDTSHLYPVAGEQTEWLASALEKRKGVPHLFPVYHVPAYPSARNFDEDVHAAVREHWVPLFEGAGVKLAFEHHDHTFKVTPPIKDGKIDPEGVVYIGDGSWAVNVRDVHDPATTWYLDKAAGVNHVHEVIIEADRRTVVSHDVDGREIHRMEQPVERP